MTPCICGHDREHHINDGACRVGPICEASCTKFVAATPPRTGTFKYGPYRNGLDRGTPDDKVEFILARVSHCGICKRRTFDYRWYNRTPWWIVPRWLGGRMDCGGECLHCLSAIEEPDCDHEWQTRPINGTATATPQCSSYECVRCGSLLFASVLRDERSSQDEE